MSIETLIKAAAYLERKDRGEHSNPFIHRINSKVSSRRTRTNVNRRSLSYIIQILFITPHSTSIQYKHFIIVFVCGLLLLTICTYSVVIINGIPTLQLFILYLLYIVLVSTKSAVPFSNNTTMVIVWVKILFLRFSIYCELLKIYYPSGAT